MVKLSLCLIVKPSDKEAKLLDRCLNSTAKYVDEICITTGKNKEVERVAKKYNCKVSYREWDDSYENARNFNFKQATGEYIFWLDADDIVKGADNLPQVMKKIDEEGIDAGVMDYLYDFDEDGVCIVKHKKARIIRNDGCVKWVGEIHEDFEEQRKLNSFFIKGIQIVHLTDNERIEESKERNLKIAFEVLRKKPDDPRSYWLVANAFLSKGDNKNAIEYYKKFIPISSSEIEILTAYHRTAAAYMALGEWEKAIQCEFKVIEIRPWFPDGYLGLGELFYKRNQFKKAKEFLLQGISKEIPEDEYIVWNPRDYDFNPLRMLADVYFELSKPKEAKMCLEECLKIYPFHKEIKRLVGVLDKEVEKIDKIDEICEKAEKINDKGKLKKLLDSVPVELKSHPKICHLRNVHFIKKESSGKDLTIFCFYTSEPFNPDIVRDVGRGGSEEAVCQVSERLANKGWNVDVYANTGLYKPKKFGKVNWKPFWEFNLRDKVDVFISWRHPMIFDFKEINADKKYVWLHDVIKPNEFTPKRVDKIDKIFALSKWQRNLFPEIPNKKFFITGNGINLGDLEKVKEKRNPYRLIYTSSPDRGLKCLLKLFPLIKKEVPEAEFHFFYGWGVWDTMYQNDVGMMKEKKEILALMEQPGVFNHDRVGQEQILKEYAKSSIFAYPTEFVEISCISAMKAQALGAIPVATNVAALNETIQFGLKVEAEDIYSNNEAQTEWVQGVVNLLKNPPTESDREPMIKWARKNFSWDNIVENWHKLFNEKNK
jgi:glycosyltransferase involved in cell wall biosynthesis